jgi:hypothetical protein
VGAPAQKPGWAEAELEAFAAYEVAIDAFFARFADAQSGRLEVGGFSWYNWDDVLEGEAVLDKYLLVAGRQDQRELYSLIYKFHHQVAVDNGWIDDTHHFYTRLYDAEHADEGFMYLWGALEVTPRDPQLRAWNEAMASWFLSTAPFNSNTKVFNSFHLGTNAGAGNDGTDTLLNLAYTYAGIRAWMTSGDDVYRQWVADYTAAWASATIPEPSPFAGALPFQIDSQSLAPGPLTDGSWWRGAGDPHMEGFDYESYGFACLGRSTHGAVVAQQLANPEADGLARALASTLSIFVEATAPAPPADAYAPEDGGFYRFAPKYLPRQFAAVHGVLHSHESQALVDAYLSVRSQVDGTERTWLDWMEFTFNRGLDTTVPAALFDHATAAAQELVGCIETLCHTGGTLPRDGDELRVYSPALIGLDYVDGAMAGKRNRRDGAPSAAPVRYYGVDGGMGLPSGVAALVRHETKTTVEVWLYNDNDHEQTLVLVGGHYGQHRIETLRELEHETARPVDCPYVRLRLPATGLARLELGLRRLSETPSLVPYHDNCL